MMKSIYIATILWLCGFLLFPASPGLAQTIPNSDQSIPPSQCPVTDPSQKSKIPGRKEIENLPHSTFGEINLHPFLLDTLNQGISLSDILSALKPYLLNPNLLGRQRTAFKAFVDPSSVSARDLSGDGVPEIIYRRRGSLNIYACQDGKYQNVFEWVSPYLENEINNVWISDYNQDGLPEMIFQDFDWASVSYGTATFIYGWQDGHLQNLLQIKDVAWHRDPAYDNAYYEDGPSASSMMDVDGDGRQELVVRSIVSNWDSLSWGPWRNQYTTFKWDGQHYVVLPKRYDPPIYRFQAVQDGDRAVFRSDYSSALRFYRQAIDDSALVWWSEERFRERFNNPAAHHWSTKPLATHLAPDPNEYPNLAAYAHYRIMLVYAAQNQPAYAQAEYQVLEKSFPKNRPGSAYTHLAELFWQGYQPAGDLREGCQFVVDSINRQPEVMDPIGAIWHGWEGIQYQPEDFCPFAKQPEPEPVVLNDQYAFNENFGDSYILSILIEQTHYITEEQIVEQLVNQWFNHYVSGCTDPYFRLQEYKIERVTMVKPSAGYDLVANVRFSYLPLQPLTKNYQGNISPNGWIGMQGSLAGDGWGHTSSYFGVYKEGKSYRLRRLMGWGT